MTTAIETADNIAAIPATSFDVATMNAIVTIHNSATGNHRTFRISTVLKGSWEGKRIVSLLTGPDNGSDYEGFGEVSDDGKVKVWAKNRGGFNKATGKVELSNWERFAQMLESPARYEARGLEYLIEKRCFRCGRRLTTPESVARNIGPECAKK